MKLSLLVNTRRRLIVLACAAFLALSAAYSPILFDGLAGTSLTAAAYACSNSSGGC